MAMFNQSHDWQERLKDIFSDDELESIADYFEKVKQHGWGGVRIEFADHRPDKWHAWPVFSAQFGRAKSSRYKPE